VTEDSKTDIAKNEVSTYDRLKLVAMPLWASEHAGQAGQRTSLVTVRSFLPPANALVRTVWCHVREAGLLVTAGQEEPSISFMTSPMPKSFGNGNHGEDVNESAIEK
jgi:hypothetical protein